MVAKDDRKRNSAFGDGLKQRLEGFEAVLLAVADVHNRVGAVHLVAQKNDQVGGRIPKNALLSGENLPGYELRILQVGEDQDGECAVGAESEIGGSGFFGGCAAKSWHQANAEQQNTYKNR